MTRQHKQRALGAFDLSVLKLLASGRDLPLGDKMIKYIGAARRLEKRGYLAKPGTRFYVTQAGEDYLKPVIVKVGEQ